MPSVAATASIRSDLPQRRLTIGMLANTYESESGMLAGGHLHLVQVAKRWTDVDVVIFAPVFARDQFSAVLPDARFVALPSLAIGTRSKALDFLYRSAASIAGLAELQRCDALLATSHFLPDVVPVILSRKPSAVIIHHTLRSVNARKTFRGIIPMFAETLSLRLSRLFAGELIAGSALARRELRGRGIRRTMSITTNGVDHLQYRPPENIDQSSRSGAVFVGRLHPSKNIDDAIRAWHIVTRRFPNEQLTIVGAEAVPAYASELRALLSELKLEKQVRIVGAVSDDQKLTYLEHAKLFVFPSGEEGWGIALAEAMRAGLPCVTYDLPIFGEIFPVGRLEAPLRDYVSLAERVIDLLGDESLHRRHAAEALELARRFSWGSAAQLEFEILRNLVIRSTMLARNSA